MKLLFPIALALFLSACGKSGKDGSNGLDAKSNLALTPTTIGVDFDDLSPGTVCPNGGLSVYTFRDENADGLHESEEAIVKSKSICHGLNGASATVTLENVSSSSLCPTGGVSIQSGSTSKTEICNGAAGLNGEQGIQGIQGVPGMQGPSGTNGSDGTRVTPVKFCSSDQSQYPEYGLVIGDEVYAVYWGVTPASPTAGQAFLTKLTPGQYQSTGGNNCLFFIP